jgi:hypothetical protein
MDAEVLDAVVQEVLAYDARQEEADAGATDPDQLYEALETARLYRLAVGRPLPPRPHYRIPGLTKAGVRAAVVLADGDPDDAYLMLLDVRTLYQPLPRAHSGRARARAGVRAVPDQKPFGRIPSCGDAHPHGSEPRSSWNSISSRWTAG